MQIYFDYDGVLVDSLDILFGLFRRSWLDLGLGREPELRDLTHAPNLTFPDLAARLEIPRSRQPEYLQHLLELQVNVAPIPPLFPGVRQVLEKLSQDYRLCVVSASARSSIARTLDAHRVATRFERICGAEDGESKSAIIASLDRESELADGRSIMVGDTAGDIRQGRRAGALTVAVTWGYQDVDRLLAEKPDFLADSPQDIASVVAQVSRGNVANPA